MNSSGTIQHNLFIPFDVNVHSPVTRLFASFIKKLIFWLYGHRLLFKREVDVVE